MPKILKTFPSPYGGVSQQSTELMLDQQCLEMVNCVPDIVVGTQRRNGLNYKAIIKNSSNIFHFYDRGEGNEQYFTSLTGSPTSPIAVNDITGSAKTITYNTDVIVIDTYLGTDKTVLKAITVQDRTFIVNTSKTVGMNIIDTPNNLYDRTAYYWLSRSSNDVDAPYNYAVYLDNYTFEQAGSDSDDVATTLAANITAAGVGFTATASGSIIQITKSGYKVFNSNGTLRVPYDDTHKYVAVRPTAVGTTEYVDVTLCDTEVTPVEDTLCYKMTVQDYYLEVQQGGITYWKKFSELGPFGLFNVPYYKKLGSTYIDKLYRINMDCAMNQSGEFTFSSWDSWGSQASTGWKGSISKLSDLPREMPFQYATVKITGDDSNNFTDYFVQYDGDTWVETRNPQDNRGSFTNMPIYMDRKSDGTFEVGVLPWEIPTVGGNLTNPTPSFVNTTINDIFFYKNRLGFTANANVILSETGGYYNFYSQTILEVLDDDPIDVAVSSNEATIIYYAVPFQRALFVFTKNSQYALETPNTATFSPLTVSFNLISRLPIDTNVRPINAGSSLFFISKTGNNASQLREYKFNNDSLIADGVDLSVQVPNYLPSIDSIDVDINLGMVFMYSKDYKNTLYCYKYLQQGSERIQSSFYKWVFGFDLNEIYVVNSTLYTFNITNLCSMDLLINNQVKVDIINSKLDMQPYSSYFTLPRWNIKVGKMETPIRTIVIKAIRLVGDGIFDVEINRLDYGTTTVRTYESGSTRDMSASILSKNDRVIITVKNSGNGNFKIDSIVLTGMYTQREREVG